jgi:hypothetical protein
VSRLGFWSVEVATTAVEGWRSDADRWWAAATGRAIGQPYSIDKSKICYRAKLVTSPPLKRIVSRNKDYYMVSLLK